MSYMISIDPGNKKCGLLLADIKSGKVIDAGISSLEKFCVFFINSISLKLKKNKR